MKGTRAKFDTQAFCDNGRIAEWFGHQSPRITERAVQFHRGTPAEQSFVLVVGYTNTHSPHTAEAPRWTRHHETASFADLPDESFLPRPGRTLRPWPGRVPWSRR